jgi:gas vesicle protein
MKNKKLIKFYFSVALFLGIVISMVLNFVDFQAMADEAEEVVKEKVEKVKEEVKESIDTKKEEIKEDIEEKKNEIEEKIEKEKDKIKDKLKGLIDA